MDGQIIAYSILSGATLGAALITVRGQKRTRKMVETNHGKTIGQHVEDLVLWSHIHTEQDNEVREALGIKRAEYPDLAAWKNQP